MGLKLFVQEVEMRSRRSGSRRRLCHFESKTFFLLWEDHLWLQEVLRETTSNRGEEQSDQAHLDICKILRCER
jgi:hypothetical protein